MIKQNESLAVLFDEIASILSYKGENIFKIRSYSRFASLCRTLTEPIADIAIRNELQTLPGVGSAISEKVREWLETGTFPLYERLSSETPKGIRDLLQLGIAPKTVRTLVESCNISDVEQLKKALAGGEIASSHVLTKKQKMELANL